MKNIRTSDNTSISTANVTSDAPETDASAGLPFGIPLSSLLCRSKTVVTRSGASGLWRYETVIDASAAVSAASCWDMSFDDDKETALLAELSGPVAEVVTWAAPVSLDKYADTLETSLWYVWECCDAESADLEALMSRLLTQTKGGALDALFQAGGYVSRLLLLDSVEVAPSWRGCGIGVHLAAHSLLTAGAFDIYAAVVAAAGAHTEVDYNAIKQRSRNLLGSLGLTEMTDDLWIGSCAMAEPGGVIAWLAEA